MLTDSKKYAKIKNTIDLSKKYSVWLTNGIEEKIYNKIEYINNVYYKDWKCLFKNRNLQTVKTRPA